MKNNAPQTKWYAFVQGKNRGRYVVNDKLCHRLFIEATSIEHACSIAESLGVYFDCISKKIDCPCAACEERWTRPTQEMNLYGLNIEEHSAYLRLRLPYTYPEIRIYYLNGTVKKDFEFKF